MKAKRTVRAEEAKTREVVHRLRSEILGNEREVWVREPVRPDEPAALAIFLDGEFYRERVGAVAVIEALEAAGEIRNTRFVFVSMESLEARWRECPCHPPFARFVLEELMPWLAERGAEAAGARVLIGLSYTGLAAAYVALQPEAPFTHLIAQSGSFWWNGCWLARELEAREEPLRFGSYLDVGEGERATRVEHRPDVIQEVSQIEGVGRFANALRARGARVEERRFAGGHDFACWRQTLPGALRWALG